MTPRLIGHSVADANGIIMTLDQAVADFLHRPQREVIGHSYKQITCPDDLAENVRILDRLEGPGAATTLTKRYLRADGALLRAEVQVSRLASPKLGELMVGTIYSADSDPVDYAPAVLWHEARWQRDSADLKAREIGSDLFNDRGWLVLLECYIAECEGRPAKPHIAHKFGTGSFVRWGRALCDMGLLENGHNKLDGFQLTKAGIAKVETLLAASIRRS